MSQAETLLNSLSGSAYVIDSTDEEYIVIGGDRVIVVPDKLKRIAVQHDHNIETVTFACPRYWDGHDMSKMVIYINYRLPDGVLGSYIADNIRVDSTEYTRMFFDWTISSAVTQIAGSLAILVCIKKTDADGVEVNHWNSELNTELYISEGLESIYSGDPTYNDILTQLLLKMEIATSEISAEADAQVASAKETISAHGEAVLASLPADYATAVSMTDNADRTKADAIICSTEGESIVVADASDDYFRGVRVFGRTTQPSTTGAQKLPYPYPQTTKTAQGITFTDNGDGSITMSGTAAANVYFDLYTETLPEIVGSHFLSGVEGGLGYKMYAYCGAVYNEDTGDGVLLENGVTRIHIMIDSGATLDTTLYPMLSAGTAALDWEPYTGAMASPNPDYPQDLVNIENPTVSVCGKNLLNVDLMLNAQFVKNDDGTYTLTKNGTSSLRFSRKADCNLPKGTYTISVSQVTGHDATVRIALIYASGREQSLAVTVDTPKTFVANGPIEKISIYMSSDVTDGKYVTIRGLMIEVGEEATAYEPYIEVQSNPSTHMLPGIPVAADGNYTDENGQMWLCDEIDLERGVYIKRVDVHILDGVSSQIHKNGDAADNYLYYAALPYTNKRLAGYCTHFTHVKGYPEASDNVGQFNTTLGNTAYFNGYGIASGDNSALSNASEFNAWLATQNDAGTPVAVCYAIATPVETTLTEEEIYNFSQIHTNFPNTTVLNDVGAWMKIRYNADTKTYLDRLPKATDEQVWAAVDAWLTAKYGLIAEEASL